MITLLIADDNVGFNLSLSNFLTKEKDIKIIGMCIDGKSALDTYLEKKPDVLILDLEMPRLNGVEILNRLSNIDSERNKTNIIVISGNHKLKSSLFSLSKVYCSLSKPCNLELVLKKIQEIKQNCTYVNSLKLSIFKFMQRLNFNMNSVGTVYLSEIILLNHERNKNNNLKSLFHIIATKNDIKYGTVKSAIYHSVNTMNRFVDTKYVKTLCPNYDGRKLTPYDIISFSKLFL